MDQQGHKQLLAIVDYSPVHRGMVCDECFLEYGRQRELMFGTFFRYRSEYLVGVFLTLVAYTTRWDDEVAHC